MGCLTIEELYQAQLGEITVLAGSTVMYYPVVLTGYSTATQARVPSEGSGVSVTGVFDNERLRAPDGAITYTTTFTLAVTAYAGTPMPGDRIVHAGVSYRVAELQRVWFGSVLSAYILILSN